MDARERLVAACVRKHDSLAYAEENPGDAHNDAELEYCDDMIDAAAKELALAYPDDLLELLGKADLERRLADAERTVVRFGRKLGHGTKPDGIEHPPWYVPCDDCRTVRQSAGVVLRDAGDPEKETP